MQWRFWSRLTTCTAVQRQRSCTSCCCSIKTGEESPDTPRPPPAPSSSHFLHFIFSLEVIGAQPVQVQHLVFFIFLSSPSISDDAEFLWRLARAARDLALQPNVEAERKKQLTYEAFENAKKALEKDETIFAVHKVRWWSTDSPPSC